LGKKLAFSTQSTDVSEEKKDRDIGFQEKRHFIAENW
jgi:hypothetical protein